ncbi:MAG: hypothetical protein KBA75_02260, partial [Alphaproteobacteria bacterium]|nr:hypothetical protein [Alphaproteobacteria bacterium]
MLLAIRDTTSTGTVEQPKQLNLITPEVVIRFPLIDRATGAVNEAHLSSKTTQIAFIPEQAP